jgi:hypothetical protein
VEVLRLIAAGKSNSEIATTLVVAVSTVKAHINNIFSKLGVTSRTQALVRAHGTPHPVAPQFQLPRRFGGAPTAQIHPPIHLWVNAAPPMFPL